MINADGARRRHIFGENGNGDGHHVVSELDARPHKPKYTEAQIKRARRTQARFAEWRRDNPDALRHAEGYAVAKAAQGERVSAKAIVEDIRRVDFTDRHGEPTSTNNDYAPLLARWIVARHPETDSHIERRRSIYDYLEGGGMCSGSSKMRRCNGPSGNE